MTYDTDQPIESTPSRHDGVEYNHPSYGLISVSRYTGGKREPLFGSEIGCDGGIRITISHAAVTQTLGRNWYYDKKRVCEVEMTPVQYAEMISSPNTQGMPCTLKWTEGTGHIKYRPIDTMTQYVETKIKSEIEELKQSTATVKQQVQDILNQKGALKKDDKDRIAELVGGLTRTITSGLPFYEKSLTESIDRQKMEARTAIEAYITHAIHKAGISAINNPETLALILQDKSED